MHHALLEMWNVFGFWVGGGGKSMTTLADLGDGVAFIEMTNVGCVLISSPSEESFLSLNSLSGVEEFAVSFIVVQWMASAHFMEH